MSLFIGLSSLALWGWVEGCAFVGDSFSDNLADADWSSARRTSRSIDVTDTSLGSGGRVCKRDGRPCRMAPGRFADGRASWRACRKGSGRPQRGRCLSRFICAGIIMVVDVNG